MPGTASPQLGTMLETVESLMETFPGPDSVLGELQGLAAFIRDTKAEIAALRPDEVKLEFLPTAADELDAIVDATARATNTIMDAMDAIQAVADGLDAAGSMAILDAITRVFEACTFQDITGQRITKIVKVLKVIEERIDKLLVAVGGAPAAPILGNRAPEAPLAVDHLQLGCDPSLLNGPALPGAAISQDEIDAMLANSD